MRIPGSLLILLPILGVILVIAWSFLKPVLGL
jgi:hypothetical protein